MFKEFFFLPASEILDRDGNQKEMAVGVGGKMALSFSDTMWAIYRMGESRRYSTGALVVSKGNNDRDNVAMAMSHLCRPIRSVEEYSVCCYEW